MLAQQMSYAADPTRSKRKPEGMLREDTGGAMKIAHVLTAVFASLLYASFVSAQNYTVSQTEIFSPQNKKVLLLQDSTGQKKVILFQTNLRVNTDGSPLSYHPQDPLGKTLALNNVCNAIAVRKGSAKDNLCIRKATFSEAIGVFEKFRDNNWTVPQGYRIIWANVFTTVKENGKDIPCVFKSGEFKGYFGSMTALRNGLTGNKGECEINDQVNPMVVPALVLVGGRNVVTNFGAQVGDLLVAYNPNTHLFSSAIIGDAGPEDNLGEGSVLLNMKLLGATTLPSNKAGTFKLSIEKTQVL